ncbi:thiamine diphosphate-binding protein [Aspergillus pseudotamarii]|uniref:Pyruvate decarboxylase n=1 Tax=Aspergillus pseudotamarii TaxID=132259 RepID=A0A5N6T7T4_ASPPS|nr:thiamine diphosphate-binding protein [Aspergillus pseudotamarii]KAE8142320.1 thiamine diphosphate-binding protein [Aspergillus pseudotamarii]
MASDIRVSAMKTPIDIAEYLFTRLCQLGVRTVGNCNELNAGYSADGYARIKGISAIVTTFGVGELSALNAIAGAYSGHVPVVHIVGQPSTASQKDGMLLHHTLGNNMVQQKVEGERLQIPIEFDDPVNETETEEYVVDVVLRYLRAAKTPVILVDAGAIRHAVLGVVHQLIQKTGFPTFVTPMGKGAVDETLPNFGGVYAGTDFNTTGFSYRTSQLNTIDFYSGHVQVRYSLYPKVRMRGILQKVMARMGYLYVQPEPTSFRGTMHSSTLTVSNGPITHSWLWPEVGNWLQEGDIVITETGTSSFGIWETRFRKGVTAISQVLWGSIGYSVGACLGASLAVQEAENFQMTAQEVSTMIRQKLNLIIFAICNSGYTIERYIHGWDEEYNDIHPWKYGALVEAFGAQCQHSYSTYQASTRDERTSLLNNTRFSSAPHFQLVELYMPKDDAPAALQLTAAAAAARNLPTQ